MHPMADVLNAYRNPNHPEKVIFYLVTKRVFHFFPITSLVVSLAGIHFPGARRPHRALRRRLGGAHRVPWLLHKGQSHKALLEGRPEPEPRAAAPTALLCHCCAPPARHGLRGPARKVPHSLRGDGVRQPPDVAHVLLPVDAAQVRVDEDDEGAAGNDYAGARCGGVWGGVERVD
jgi:hypothetical protein